MEGADMKILKHLILVQLVNVDQIQEQGAFQSQARVFLGWALVWSASEVSIRSCLLVFHCGGYFILEVGTWVDEFILNL